jgi:hypothetical protein
MNDICKQVFGLIAQVSMMRGMDLPHVDGKASVSWEPTSLAATSILLLLYIYAFTQNFTTLYKLHNARLI